MQLRGQVGWWKSIKSTMDVAIGYPEMWNGQSRAKDIIDPQESSVVCESACTRDRLCIECGLEVVTDVTTFMTAFTTMRFHPSRGNGWNAGAGGLKRGEVVHQGSLQEGV